MVGERPEGLNRSKQGCRETAELGGLQVLQLGLELPQLREKWGRSEEKFASSVTIIMNISILALSTVTIRTYLI